MEGSFLQGLAERAATRMPDQLRPVLGCEEPQYCKPLRGVKVYSGVEEKISVK